MPRLCVYGTVLNSVDTLERSIASFYRPDAEIVIVDGGSTDGTYERLLEISKDYNLKVHRLPGSSRGLGRQYALYKCPEGSYAVAVLDLDDEYNQYFHRYVDWAVSSVGGPAPAPFVSLREHALSRGGWRDLNYAEEVEFVVRVGFSRCLQVPIRRTIFRAPAGREARYARGLGYIGRLLRVGVDDFRGNGYRLAERVLAEAERLGGSPRLLATVPLIALESVASPTRYRACGPLTNRELFDLLCLSSLEDPSRAVGLPRDEAYTSFHRSLAAKVRLRDLTALAESALGPLPHAYSCTNGQYLLARSEAGREAYEASAARRDVRCAPAP